jgi:hypothetical protein
MILVNLMVGGVGGRREEGDLGDLLIAWRVLRGKFDDF